MEQDLVNFAIIANFILQGVLQVYWFYWSHSIQKRKHKDDDALPERRPKVSTRERPKPSEVNPPAHGGLPIGL